MYNLKIHYHPIHNNLTCLALNGDTRFLNRKACHVHHVSVSQGDARNVIRLFHPRVRFRWRAGDVGLHVLVRRSMRFSASLDGRPTGATVDSGHMALLDTSPCY